MDTMCFSKNGYYISLFFLATDAPEVKTSNPDTRMADVKGNLTLDCNYVGFPMPTVTWRLNGTECNFSTNPDVTITTSMTGTNMTTTLTWTNVPVEAQGRHYCILINDAGSVRGSYTVQIASES